MACGIGLLAGVSACSSPLAPAASTTCATSVTLTRLFTMGDDRDLDVVFVLDDGPAMAGWQASLPGQLANLMAYLPCPADSHLTSLHIGVVSSDLGIGAPGAGCTAQGDDGVLRSQPQGTCTDSTLAPGARFISVVGETRNYSAPDDAAGSGAAKALACIAQLGDGGCSFGQPLAALDRALGADGLPPPAANVGFLRSDAYLLIVLISNEDDCSAPAGGALFSPSEATQGPLTHYRCNHAGHVCTDPSGASLAPAIDPPAGAVSLYGVPTLPLTDCRSSESDGALTPVSKFVADIKQLKSEPDRILVTGLIGPPSPYAVEWVADAASPSGLRAEVAPSCGGEAADGSGPFGEPGVRLSQFIEAFPNSAQGSVCDAHYGEVLAAICSPRLAIDVWPPCLTTNLQMKTDAQGQSVPDCVVSEHLTAGDGSVQNFVLPACSAVATGAPCWSVGPSGSGCPSGEGLFTVVNEPVGSDPANYTASVSVSCQLPPPARSADAATCPD